MTYRIDVKVTAESNRVEVQGLVDAAALGGICAAIRAARARRVLFKAGCQVEPVVLEALARLEGVELVAESPFLARWIDKVRPGAY